MITYSSSGILNDTNSLFSSVSPIIYPIVRSIYQQISKEVISNFKETLTLYPVTNIVLEQYFNKIAIIISGNPLTGFKEVRNFFFEIPLDVNQPLSSTRLSSQHWISKIGEKKDNIKLRMLLFHCVESYVANIVCKMLDNINRLDIDEKTSSKFKFLVKEYMSKIINLTKKEEYLNAFIPIAEYYEKIIGELSMILPKRTWKMMIKYITRTSNGSLRQYFLLKIFRSISMDRLDKRYSDLDNEQFFSILTYKNASCEWTTAASLFFSGLVVNALLLKKNKPNDIFLKKIFEIVKENTDIIQIFPLQVGFYVNSGEGDTIFALNSLLNSVKVLSKNNPNSEPILIHGLKLILNGKNYRSHYMIIKNMDNLSWRMEQKDSVFLRKIFSTLLFLPSLSSNYEQIRQFIIQLAVNDINIFTEECAPILSEKGCYHQLFDSYIVLLSNTGAPWIHNLKKHAVELIKKFIETVPVSKLLTEIPGIPKYPCIQKDFYNSSYPEPPKTAQLKIMSQDIVKLQKVVSPNDKAPFLFDPDFNLSLSKDVQAKDTSLSKCLAIIMFLDYNDTLTSFIASKIFDSESFISSLSVRGLAFLAANNPDKIGSILRSLSKIVPESFEQFYVLFVCIKLIFRNQKDKSLINDHFDYLFPLIIVALCSPSYELRAIALEVCDMTYMSSFFETNLIYIMKETLQKIAIIFTCDIDQSAISNLSLQSFRDFALSKHEIIYHIYLSNVFCLMGVKKIANFERCSSFLRRTFDILKNKTEISGHPKVYPLLMLNISTFLLATADFSISTNSLIECMEATIPIIVDKYNRSPFEYMIYSFVSVTNQYNIKPIINFLLAKLNGSFCSDLLIKALCLSSLSYLQRPDFILGTNLCNMYVNVINAITNYFNDNRLVSTENVEMVGNLSPKICNLLCYMLNVINLLCGYYNRTSRTSCHGPFLHKCPPQSPFVNSDWFIFLLNLALLNDNFPQSLVELGKTTFANYCFIHQIPESIKNDKIQYKYRNLVNDLINDNTQALANILLLTFAYSCKNFINESIKSPNYFRCIALLFDDPFPLDKSALRLSTIALQPMTQLDNDFSQHVYVNIGNLLALCMFFLSEDVRGYESDALHVLRNLCLSGALIFGTPEFSKAIKLVSCETLVSASLSQLSELSRSLSIAFFQVAEQYICMSLQILSNHYYSTFICLLEPWLAYINLRADSQTLVEGTEILFWKYTPISFLREFINVLCAEQLQPPTISLIETMASSDAAVEFIFVFCINSYQSNRNNAKRLLIRLCKIKPDLPSQVASFLEARYWFHSAIQSRVFDRYFDFDRFLNEMRPAGVPNKQTKTNNNEIVTSDEIVSFALEISLDLLPNYPYILPSLLSFCLTRPSSMQDQIAPYLFKLIQTKTPTATVLSNILKDRSQEFFEHLFKWTVCCGDPDIATIAGRYAVDCFGTAHEKMLAPAMLALAINVETLRENTQIDEEKRSKKQIAKILRGDVEINIKGIYAHVAILAELISKICVNVQRVPPLAISYMIGLTSCGDSEYQLIFQSGVQAALEIIKVPDFKDIKDSDIIHGGMLHNMAKYNILVEKRKSDVPINAIFLLCSRLLESGLYNLLVPSTCDFCDDIDNSNDNTLFDVTNEMKIAMSVLFIIPYLATNCQNELFESVKSCVKSTLGLDISVIWEVFRSHKLGPYGKEMLLLITKLYEACGQRLTSAVVKLYSMILMKLDEYSYPIYCVSLVLQHIDNNRHIHSIKRIVIPALKDKDNERIKPLSILLQKYQKNGTFEAIPPLNPLKHFPIAFLKKNEFRWKKEDHPNLFLTWDDLPPLYPIDPSFFYLEIIEELHKACDDVRVNPFDEWSQILFKAEGYGQRDSTSGFIRLELSESNTDGLNKILADSINDNQANDQYGSAKQMLQVKNFEELQSISRNNALQIPYSVFLPTLKEIDDINPDDEIFPHLVTLN